MPLTLLLDLDDTLLDSNVGEFIPAYFQALSRHLERWVAPEVMLPALMSGTQHMLDNLDPSRTLQQVFDGDFYPRMGIAKRDIEDSIEDFYDRVFRQLGSLTARRPGAKELVDWALAAGHRVVIATDPLFPRKAVFERIRWAGLEPEAFELVSSYETFHFTKSHAEYYAEVLGQLGWPDGPVLMVGNDEERDLRRAQELGLVTYRVGSPQDAVAAGMAPVTGASTEVGSGALNELRPWLEAMEGWRLDPALKSRRAIVAILTSTPAVLGTLVGGLSKDAWRHEPSPDDWAMIELISHLRDTEREVHRAQIRVLQQEAQPFVPRPDAAVWAKQRRYLDEDGPTALAEFTAARLETLRQLAEFGEDAWGRSARHAIFGPTNFTEVVGFMADHDRLHIQQAWRTLRAAL